jgi:hypothetical protein
MLAIKLDMMYRGLSVDDARKRFAELVPKVPPPVVDGPKRRRLKATPLPEPTRA